MSTGLATALASPAVLLKILETVNREQTTIIWLTEKAK
jgi:hypothetical protein